MFLFLLLCQQLLIYLRMIIVNFTKISAFEKIKNIMIQKKKCRSGSIRRCLYDYEGDEKDAENDNLEMFIIHFISKLSPIIYKRI